MTFRKVMSTLHAAAEGSVIGATYSIVKGCINWVSIPELIHNSVQSINVADLVNDFLTDIINQFPNCKIYTSPYVTSYACSSNDSGQFSALNAIDNNLAGLNSSTDSFPNNYNNLVKDFFESVLKTFILNVGIDTAVFAIAAVGIYLLSEHNKEQNALKALAARNLQTMSRHVHEIPKADEEHIMAISDDEGDNSKQAYYRVLR